VNITPISLWFIGDISIVIYIVNGVYKPINITFGGPPPCRWCTGMFFGGELRPSGVSLRFGLQGAYIAEKTHGNSLVGGLKL
jgi:hypothetical protein